MQGDHSMTNLTTDGPVAVESLDGVMGGQLVGAKDVEMAERWMDRGESIGGSLGSTFGDRGASWGRAIGGSAGLLGAATKVATGWVNDTLGWPGNQLVDLATRKR